MHVHIIIPVHNRIQQTLECLSCIAQQTYADRSVVVVDDGSTDGTAAAVQERFPDVDILQGDGSLWWTGAMHKGVAHILRSAQDGDFMLSLNNDTTFEPEYIGSLVRMSQKHGRAIVGSLSKDSRDRGKVLFRGSRIDWDHFNLHVADPKLPDDGTDCNEDVNVLPGRGLLIPTEVFRRIGNFRKDRFPHYIADYDFTTRANNAGVKLVLSYKSVIYARPDLTGSSIKEQRPISIREAASDMFSIRSDRNIRDAFYFVLDNSPRRSRNLNLLIVALGALNRLRVLAPLANAVKRAYMAFYTWRTGRRNL